MKKKIFLLAYLALFGAPVMQATQSKKDVLGFIEELERAGDQGSLRLAKDLRVSYNLPKEALWTQPHSDLPSTNDLLLDNVVPGKDYQPLATSFNGLGEVSRAEPRGWLTSVKETVQSVLHAVEARPGATAFGGIMGGLLGYQVGTTSVQKAEPVRPAHRVKQAATTAAGAFVGAIVGNICCNEKLGRIGAISSIAAFGAYKLYQTFYPQTSFKKVESKTKPACAVISDLTQSFPTTQPQPEPARTEQGAAEPVQAEPVQATLIQQHEPSHNGSLASQLTEEQYNFIREYILNITGKNPLPLRAYRKRTSGEQLKVLTNADQIAGYVRDHYQDICFLRVRPQDQLECAFPAGRSHEDKKNRDMVEGLPSGLRDAVVGYLLAHESMQLFDLYFQHAPQELKDKTFGDTVTPFYNQMTQLLGLC